MGKYKLADDRFPVRLEADLLASELAKGKSLERIQREQSWSNCKLTRRLAILRARNHSQLAPESGEDAFHRYVDRTKQSIDGHALVQRDYTEGPTQTVIETHTEQVTPTETLTTRKETVAHNGVTASDFLTANRDTVAFVEKVIKLGQSLGVYPKVEEAKTASPSLSFTQILAAVRIGDFGTVERVAEGQDVVEKETPVVIDVPNLAEVPPAAIDADAVTPPDEDAA